MGDLTKLTYQMCRSIDGPRSFSLRDYHQHGLFSERHQPTCSCPAFKYSVTEPKMCKHIQQLEADACAWHEEYSNEVQDIIGVCPRCGGEAIAIIAAA